MHQATAPIQSLDPRITRLQLPDEDFVLPPKPRLDQLETYQVFLKTKEGKPWESVGIVHAYDAETAFLFGKEQYTRRGNTNYALGVVPTRLVYQTATSEKSENALKLPLTPSDDSEAGGVTDHSERAQTSETPEPYAVFYQKKRGKHFGFAGLVPAPNGRAAVGQAAETLFSDPCVAVWVFKEADFWHTAPADTDIWDTLPEKQYREAVQYKSMDKITEFKNRQKQALNQ